MTLWRLHSCSRLLAIIMPALSLNFIHVGFLIYSLLSRNSGIVAKIYKYIVQSLGGQDTIGRKRSMIDSMAK